LSAWARVKAPFHIMCMTCSPLAMRPITPSELMTATFGFQFFSSSSTLM
jgi:hypothetical protein